MRFLFLGPLLCLSTLVSAQNDASFKLVQAEGYAYSFEVPLNWNMGQAAMPDYDMIMGTSPDSVMQVYYHQYKTGNLQERFQNMLTGMNPKMQTLAQYTRTTYDTNGNPQTAYFAKGHGDYNTELKGFMLAGY
ncbi:MAG: hypothetical protein AAF740_11165, partial [Bacteroidota bacterium]